MGFYLLEDGGETGTIDTTVWNGTNVDTEAKLTVEHYSDLVGYGRREIPYRGGYAFQVNLALGTADAYLESTLVALPLASPLWVRFYLYVEDLVWAVNDAFTLLAVQSAGPVAEAVIGLRNTAGRTQVYAGETHNAVSTVGVDLLPGSWHCIEMGLLIDSGGGDGTLALVVDGYPVGAGITALSQAAITHVQFGVQNIDAGTTGGYVLLDELVMHATRPFGFPSRYPEDMNLTKSGLVLPGPGCLRGVTLLGGSAGDGRLRLYDRDTAPPAAWMPGSLIAPELTTTSAFEVTGERAVPILFSRGLWCDLAGSESRGHFQLDDGLVSAGAIRSYARRRSVVDAVF